MANNIQRIRPAVRGMRMTAMVAAIAGCIAHSAAYANPQGGVVTNGQATFNTQGSVLTITNTPGAIINWRNFSINADETTRFLQQSASSTVLNRIVGQDPSQILGTLQSNGKVFLINPNGILFGQGARVDTNGLVASTLGITDQDFLAGKRKFTAGANAGAVQNQGTITTPSGGQVYLIAPSVTNSGIITSPQGEVVLAAGHSVSLVDSGDPDLHVVVSAPQDKALNLGQIVAHSGKVGIYGALVNQNGIVNADSAVVGKNGKIVFKSSGDTILGDGSHTSATGAGKGGEVHVLGERVGLTGDAQIDVSGEAGGGTVLVGGDYHGENAAIQNAKRTYVGSDTRIKADATVNGNGGKVIVWSDEVTRDYGNISARGGALGGNGGFVESSGKQTLDHLAKVDVFAPKGKGGTLLLDPAMITIVDGTSDGSSGAANDGSAFFQGSSTPGTINFADPDIAFGVSRVYQSEIEQIGAGTNIVLEATDYINTSSNTFGGLVTLPVNSNLTMRTRNAATDGTGSIGINLTGSGDGTGLEFRTQGTGTITLQTGTGASPQSADISVGKLTTAGGAIIVNASGNLTLAGAATTPGSGNGGNISLTSGGAMALGGSSIDARAGVAGPGTSGDVTLTSGGAINMLTGDTIYANQLTMTSAGGISGTASFNSMTTQVNSLNATNTGSGDINVSNSGSNLSINDPFSVGYGLKNLASAGGIYISTGAGETLNVNSLISANNGSVSLNGDGGINFAAGVSGGASGSVALFSTSGAISGTGIVSGNNLQVNADNGISLQTAVGFLSVGNESGSNPISITNTGVLHLEDFRQNGSGGIFINNTGALFADSCDCNFYGGTGGLTLTTDSALTLNGVIGSGAGNLTFNAGAGVGNKLTVNTNIDSTGLVVLKAGGAVSLTNGDTISANQLQIAAGGGIYGTASTDPMATMVASLNASNGGSGPIRISNSGSNLSIADIGTVGYGVKSVVAGGLIDISTGTGETLNLTAPVSATGGTINLNGAGGINLYASTLPEIASNGGNINLSASDAGATISTAAGTQISSGGGTVSLMSDKMNLLGGINATTGGIVSLTPNGGLGIDLGVNTDLNNTLELSNSELGGITAGVVRIGNSGSGAIDIKSTLTSGFPVLSLTSSAGITQQAGALLGGALSLNLVGSAVTLTQANPTGVIAGSATGGSFQYHSSNGIAVSTVDGQQGISSAIGVALVSDSTNGINQSAPIVTGGLALQSAGSVVLNNSSNQIGALAASLINASNLNVFSSSALTLNSVLGINGITTQNSNINLSVASSGTLNALQGINAGAGSVNLGAGNIMLGGGAAIDGSSIVLNTLQSGGSISTTSAGARIGDTGGTNTSNVKLVADSVNFTNGSPTVNAGQSITYSNFTDNASIATSPLINATWNAPYFVIGNNNVAGANTTANITVDGALNQAGKTIVLAAGGNISQTAAITAASLAIQSGTSTGSASSVQLTSGNAVNNIAASTNGGSFSFNDTNAVTVSSISDGTHTVTGIASGNGNIDVTATSGDLIVSSPVAGGTGSALLISSSGQVNGTGLVSANSLGVQAGDGISLQTQVANLHATNGGGANPISFSNTGTLHLQNFLQNGTGDILVDNIGPLFVDSGSTISTGPGAITLTAHSPLTVDGTVSSTSGNITLFAGSTGTFGAGDTLTINGQVTSGGNVTLKAGDAIVFGSASTVHAGGTLSQANNLNLPSLATCMSAPATANCSLVLPSLSVCTSAPTTPGCSVVLPSLSTCVAAPSTAGCSAVLPTLAQCAADPALSGCSVVLPTLAQCAADPGLAGCSTVLPTLAQCTTDPMLAGCTAVLPTIEQCTSAPALAGCEVVLPVAGSSTDDVSQAIQTTVALLNASTESTDGTQNDSGETDKKTDAGDHTGGSSKDSGAKQNENTEKLYCN